MCRGLEGGREAVQGAVAGQGEGERGGRGVVGDVGRRRLSLRWSAASAAAVGGQNKRTRGKQKASNLKRGKQFIFL